MNSIDPNILTAVSALSGTIVGGLISYFLQKDKNKHEIELLKENNKTEFMAENTAKHYLSHKGYTDRSFEVLKKHLGGFEENELRKILVRAGAIRIYKEDGTEMWRLLSRSLENAEKKGYIRNEP
jgi:lipopolysaccharide export system protein LptC